MWLDRPLLGVGAGNFELSLPAYGVFGVRTHANSWYLQSLAEGGILLFAATLALVAAVVAALRTRARGAPVAVGVAMGPRGLCGAARAGAAPDRRLSRLLSQGRRRVVAAARYSRRSRRSRRLTAGLGEPLVVVTNWGAHGAALLGALVLVAIAMGGVYRRILERAATFSVPALAALAAVALAAAWCAPVLFSSDVYAYAAYGELARLGLDPYARVAPGSGDALVRDAIWQWSGPFPICVYGPAFVLARENDRGGVGALGNARAASRHPRRRIGRVVGLRAARVRRVRRR